MKEIKAKEGMFLTQAKEVEDRIYVRAIKGIGINKADWRDATLDEKEEYERLMQERYEPKEG